MVLQLCSATTLWPLQFHSPQSAGVSELSHMPPTSTLGSPWVKFPAGQLASKLRWMIDKRNRNGSSALSRRILSILTDVPAQVCHHSKASVSWLTNCVTPGIPQLYHLVPYLLWRAREHRHLAHFLHISPTCSTLSLGLFASDRAAQCVKCLCQLVWWILAYNHYG
ncbi:uncharacterized protein LOC112530121 isoform X1 [Gallus gallus]|uniref:uncharacterized protein LOC112530121 isoform X1 n=1 Tax=Gallus gallus TaxID=9031 RepID=UPI001AE95B35|nr:uncharacterized protein LOC112530121 isoform X1 [Gallus gallus]